MAARERIRFFIDHCVPDSVGHALREAGYQVILLRERIATDSADPLVAAVSELSGAILVSLDSDFKSIAPRIPRGERQRFRKLSRIGLRCKAPICAQRLMSAMSLIEHEWAFAQTSADKRIIIEIGPTYVRTLR